MKILVTGATGFLGSHLVEHLARMGHDVYALVRSEEKFKDLNLPATAIVGSLQHRAVHSFIRKLPHDLNAVIHTAGVVHTFDTKEFYDVNARSTKRLIKDLSKMFPELHFCLISSLAAAGPSSKGRAKLEDDPCNPVSHYGHSKHLAEIFFERKAPALWKKTIIRPPIVIGPRDDAFVEVFQMVKKGFIIIPGVDGHHKEFSFISVHDLCEAIEHAVSLKLKKTSPEVFFVSHPRPFTYGELIARIHALLQTPKKITLKAPYFLIFMAAVIFKVIHKIYPPFNNRLTIDKILEMRAYGWVASSNKADEILSLNYRWNLEQTLKEAFEDYKRRGKI